MKETQHTTRARSYSSAVLRPYQCTSQSNFDGTSFAGITIFKEDSRVRKGLLETINKETHSGTKSETSNDMMETVLHTAGTGNYTEQHASRIDREAYQTTPNRVQRRKGGSANCCKLANRAAAADGASKSLGSHAIDGPNLAFWAGVGIAILFQISAVLILA